ncbi:hypothetical protein TNCV_2850501 [Trichonephila clavipes]|nr:hypothetical protein TNCV_2850501 [Trichonephila clavipes]
MDSYLAARDHSFGWPHLDNRYRHLTNNRYCPLENFSVKMPSGRMVEYGASAPQVKGSSTGLSNIATQPFIHLVGR